MASSLDAGPPPSTDKAQRMVADILSSRTLYEVLGCAKYADDQDLRRGYMSRARIVHPDKASTEPDRIAATGAFQKLSFAYTILSSPSSRRFYDTSPKSAAEAWQRGSEPAASGGDLRAADETLNSVLYSIWSDFVDGDFSAIRMVINAINETNSTVQVGHGTVESLEQACTRLREALLSGGTGVRVIRDELIRLYEIQQSLRALRWLDITGRLRHTLELTRVVCSIPLAIDRALKDEAEHEFISERRRLAESADPGAPSRDDDEPASASGTADAKSQQQRRHKRRPARVSWIPPSPAEISQRRANAAFLGPRLETTLILATSVLESGEGWLGKGRVQATA